MSRVGDIENGLFGRLQAQLQRHRPKNQRQWRFYDGKEAVKNLGIAIPHSMVGIEAVMGWPEIIVDALAERIQWEGWTTTSGDSEFLRGLWLGSDIADQFNRVKLDALCTGVGFMAFSGAEDAAEEAITGPVIATAVSSQDATFMWDARRNRVRAAYSEQTLESGALLRRLYLPSGTWFVEQLNGAEERRWVPHEHDRCNLVAFPNQLRAGEYLGRSEITSTIRYYTQHGMRTILGMEYNREIYTTPQKYMINVLLDQVGIDPDAPEDVQRQQGLKAAMTKALIIEPEDPDEWGPAGAPKPEVGQFTAAPPTPYIEELRMVAQLVSAQSGVPATYLGFTHDNPPSADAIRASEARLVKRAEDRQKAFGRVLQRDVAYLCHAIGKRTIPDLSFVASVVPLWRDPSTPTLASSVDAAVKLVQAGIAPPGSEVVWDMIGLSTQQRETLKREFAELRASQRASSLVEAVRATPVSEDVVELVRANRPVGDFGLG